MTKTDGGLTRGGLRWSATVTLVVVAAVGLAALVGWRVVAAEARGDVTVSWSGPISCDGTTVRERRSPSGDGRLQAIAMRRGMRCTLPVRVANDSRFPVVVTRVRLPFMGPGGGAGVQVRRLEGREPIKRRAVDAVFSVDKPLSPGESFDVQVVFEFRPPPEGCSSARSLLGVPEFPQVTVLALGRPGVVRSDRTAGFRGTPDSDCSDG